MLVLPWFFKEEFLKRESIYLQNGGRFIFPLPKLEVI
jgi:NDP-4-keto-2,6-dideoxyhexose 3-C-methyltransferase